MAADLQMLFNSFIRLNAENCRLIVVFYFLTLPLLSYYYHFRLPDCPAFACHTPNIVSEKKKTCNTDHFHLK